MKNLLKETEKSFLDAKKWFMAAVKGSVASSTLSSTKKETVKLPTFEGE